MTDSSITEELRISAETISNIDSAQIEKAADIIYECVKNDGRVIYMGNGGSSADAQHIAAELSGRFKMDRPAMAGLSLSNIAPVTAIANDYSYDIVFKRQVEAFCRKGDVVVGLSTSGNSNNVILAMEKAKEIGATTISFTKDGGKMKDMADHAVIIPADGTDHIQEGYLVANHIICGIVERRMFGRLAVFADRDDTLCPDVPHNGDPAKMKVYPWVPESVKRLNDAGLDLIVITNQSGVGRGMFTLDDMKAVNDEMIRQIEAGGGKVKDVFYCPHAPDEGCRCRKPEIGMGMQAVAAHDIDPSRCWMIGDKEKDMEFGRRMGMEPILVGKDFTFADATDRILSELGKGGHLIR